MRYGATVLVAALLVVAGCVSPTASGPDRTTATPVPTPDEPTDPTDSTNGTERETVPPDPDTDRIGWEDGYWYNESIAASNAGGLNDSEFAAVRARTEARVEYLRGKEFTEPVEVKRVPVDQRVDAIRPEEGEAFMTFEDARYEALFMVGEDASGREQFWSTFDNRGAFYDYWNHSAILLITNASEPKVLPWRFSHEMAHALQDQRFNLTDYIAHPTMDGSYARRAVVEGGAKLVGDRYARLCRNGEWECLSPPDRSRSGGGPGHVGLFYLQLSWYEHGKAFLWPRYQERGWAAVDELYRQPPASMEQVIVPGDYPDDDPVTVSLSDATSDGWERVRPGRGFPYQKRPADARNGQAAIAAMFSMTLVDELPNNRIDIYNQSGVLNFSEVVYENWSTAPAKPHVDLDFPAVDGWDGDRLHVYRRGNETGYVWRLAWETPADAREFHETYRDLLAHWGARPAGERTWRIDAELSPFDGNAYHVSRDGDTVTIVNAPTIEGLDEVYGPVG